MFSAFNAFLATDESALKKFTGTSRLSEVGRFPLTTVRVSEPSPATAAIDTNTSVLAVEIVV